MESLHKHLEFLQLTITRMGANSFLIKGWTVTLISALFVLSSNEAGQFFVLLALIPAFLFWSLDGYFLWQERRFRILYNIVRSRKNSEIDYSMHDPAVDEMDAGWLSATLSFTIFSFHGILVFAIISVFFIEGLSNAS